MVSLVPLVVLFGFSAFFSCAETALFSISASQRAHIREHHPLAYANLSRILDDPARLLSTLLVGNTLVNFAIATLGYRFFRDLFPVTGGVLAVPLITLLLILLGEILPKQLGLRYGATLAPLVVRPLLICRRVLCPFNFVFGFASRVFAPLLARERRALCDDELISVLSAAAEKGEFAAADAEMIEGVLRLAELHVNDEMTPRVDMEAYDRDLPEKARHAARQQARHRYLPVINRSPDAVEGVLDVETGRIERALFVPETLPLDDLLVRFQTSGKSLAVVLDEYGGTAGVIAKSDVLEIIFGPAVFARADTEPAIVHKGKNVWEIDARVNLDEINRELGLALFAEDSDRLSGWVQFHAECIPPVGASVLAEGCRATVLKRRRRRIDWVRLEVLKFPDADTDDTLIAQADEAAAETEHHPLNT